MNRTSPVEDDAKSYMVTVTYRDDNGQHTYPVAVIAMNRESAKEDARARFMGVVVENRKSGYQFPGLEIIKLWPRFLDYVPAPH